MTSDNDLDEERLLSVLTHGSTGRNPTFFKAYGHNDVFGLRVAIPEGCTTLEVAENLPREDSGGIDDSSGLVMENQNVLYVQLPEGHPVITGADHIPTQISCNADIEIPASVVTTMSSAAENSTSTPVILSGKSAAVQPSLSFEEAVEQAEFTFDDDDQNIEDITPLDEVGTKSTDSNLLPSSSRTSPTASVPTISPDLKPVPVLSTTKEPASNISNFLRDQTLVLTTAAPVNTLDASFVTETHLGEQHNKLSTNVLGDNSENVVDNLMLSSDVTEVQNVQSDKSAVTVIKFSKHDLVSNDNLDNTKPGKINSVMQNDNLLNMMHRKNESSSRLYTITNAPKTILSSVTPRKESPHESSRKETRGNPATEIVSILSSTAAFIPVNKNQASNVEIGESRKRKEESISELEVLSNSVMVMTNVEDEIEVDGANNYTDQCSEMSISKQNISEERLVNTGTDEIDSKERHTKLKEDLPLQASRTESALENSRRHNLRPKRTLRHVHALKQQAKRRKRNTCIAAAAASGGTINSQTISNTPEPTTISMQRTVARKPSIGKDNGGKYLY